MVLIFCSTHFLNVNLLPNVNHKCFCDDAWETLLLLKRKRGWQRFFSFLDSRITVKREVSSAKALVLEDKPSPKLLIYI